MEEEERGVKVLRRKCSARIGHLLSAGVTGVGALKVSSFSNPMKQAFQIPLARQGYRSRHI